MHAHHNDDHLVPMNLLAAVALLAAAGLFAVTFVIESEILRYYCLGASTALLVLVTLQLAVTKAAVWPRRLSLRRQHDAPPAC